MKTAAIDVAVIELGGRRRALSEDAVQRLAGSMKDIGLMSPISVRIADNVMIDGKPCDGVPILVAGAHRLAAAKSLGWSHIDCIEVEDDPVAAELWEIAENLHRCDLTAEERHAHLRRYAELVAARPDAKPVHDGQVCSGGRGNKSVARIVADETGVSLNTVKRATGQLAPAPRPALVEVKDAYDAVAAQADAIVRRLRPDSRPIFGMLGQLVYCLEDRAVALGRGARSGHL